MTGTTYVHWKVRSHNFIYSLYLIQLLNLSKWQICHFIWNFLDFGLINICSTAFLRKNKINYIMLTEIFFHNIFTFVNHSSLYYRILYIYYTFMGIKRRLFCINHVWCFFYMNWMATSDWHVSFSAERPTDDHTHIIIYYNNI